MAIAFRFIGGVSAAVATFALVFLVAWLVTGGSIWMLAFFPLLVAAPMSVGFFVLGPMMEER